MSLNVARTPRLNVLSVVFKDIGIDTGTLSNSELTKLIIDPQAYVLSTDLTHSQDLSRVESMTRSFC